MAAAASSSASTSTKDSIDVSEAVNHLIQGKRHMLVADYASAVASLQLATQIFTDKYGEMANECAEAYFNYGKALLELARLETGVLGNALDGVPEEDEEKDSDESESNDDQVEDPDKLSVQERETIIDDVGNAIEENSRELDSKVAEWNAKEKAKNSDIKSSDGIGADEHKDVTVEGDVETTLSNGNVEIENSPKDGDEDDDEDENEEEEDAAQKELEIEKSPENNENDENGVQDEEEKEDKEEEVTNLQLAWEVIELAKIIFERQVEEKPAMKLKSADAYLKLGEIAIESGNYTQAKDDLGKCLVIQQAELEADDRLIAETHYQLGLAFSFDGEFKKGIDSFERALDLIKTRITNLETKLCNETSADAKDTIEREIKDLNDIIPEIKSKVEDTEDMKKSAAKAQADAIKEALAQQKVMAGDEASSSSSSQNPFNSAPQAFAIGSPVKPTISSSSPTKAVSNINHLVRKKRKPEEDSSQAQLKKICKTEIDVNIQNGDKTNGSADQAKAVEETAQVDN